MEWIVSIPIIPDQRLECHTCNSTLMPQGAPFCAWCGAPQSNIAPSQHPIKDPIISQNPLFKPFVPPSPRRPHQHPSVPPSPFASSLQHSQTSTSTSIKQPQSVSASSSIPTPSTPFSSSSSSSSSPSSSSSSSSSSTSVLKTILSNKHRPSLKSLGATPTAFDSRTLKSLWKVSSSVVDAVRYQRAVGVSLPCSGAGWRELRLEMLAMEMSAQHCSEEWVRNHYGLIVWKLASLERTLPHLFAQKALSHVSVLTELLYRYEREYERGHRPILKQIFEHDESPSRFMILCVSDILIPSSDSNSSNFNSSNFNSFNSNSSNSNSSNFNSSNSNSTSAPIIELTDGWYRIRASLDDALRLHLAQGRIFIGQKLRIFGAQLSANAEPGTPFEAYPRVSLQLCVNGTRRCDWAAPLGLQRAPVFFVRLPTLVAQGGMVPAIDLVVQRVYGMRFLESTGDGRKISRSERGEQRIRQRDNARLLDFLEEKMKHWHDDYNDDDDDNHNHNHNNHNNHHYHLNNDHDVEKRNPSHPSLLSTPTRQLKRQRNPNSSTPTPFSSISPSSSSHTNRRRMVEQLSSGEDLYSLFLEERQDPSFLAMLIPMQRTALQQHRDRVASETEHRMQQRLTELVQEQRPELDRDKHVVPYLTVRVTDCRHDIAVHAQLTVWRPTEEQTRLFREGQRLWLFGVKCGHFPQYLVTTPFTQIMERPASTASRFRFAPRSLLSDWEQLGALETEDRIGDREFDAVGVLIMLDERHHAPGDTRGAYRQRLYVSDTHAILCVSFSSDEPVFFPAACEGNLRASQPLLLALRNLQYTGYDQEVGVFSARATAVAEVAIAPQHDAATVALRSLCNDAEGLERLGLHFGFAADLRASRHLLNSPLKPPLRQPPGQDEEILEYLGEAEFLPGVLPQLRLHTIHATILTCDPSLLQPFPSSAFQTDHHAIWLLRYTSSGRVLSILLVSEPGPTHESNDEEEDLISLNLQDHDDLESLEVLQDMLDSSQILIDDEEH